MTYVQLDHSAVIAVFSCDQDPGVWPNVVAVEDDDERLVSYLEKLEQLGIKRPL